jgi:alpha-tubulin suppressor-like RCC1 family protein
VLFSALLALGGCKEPASPDADGLSGVSISDTAFDLEVGEGAVLTATSSSIEGSPGSPAGLEWSSSDTRVAGVDALGRVSGRAPGRATVFVRLGRHTDSATVRVGQVAQAGTPAWASVHAGPRFTCALSASGERFCWGENPFGSHGSGIRRLHTSTHAPVATGDPVRYTGLSGGSFHGCGVALDGAGFCWGNNTGRQTFYELLPQRMDIPGRLRQVSSGAEHACAVSEQGAVYCWGSNLKGALGNPAAATRQAAPLRVETPVQFATVAAGFAHTCALSQAGEAFCWGEAMAGELGEGSPTVIRTSPHPVAGGLRFARISAGNTATCAITAEGVGYCWGVITLNAADGPRRGETAVPVRLEIQLRFAQLEVGSGHTCGRTPAGEVYCWGLNEFGQAGAEPSEGGTCASQYVDGRVPCAPMPRLVSDSLRFSKISAGRHHTCGVTIDAALYCWGRNDGGQLGAGRIRPYSAAPARVASAIR